MPFVAMLNVEDWSERETVSTLTTLTETRTTPGVATFE